MAEKDKLVKLENLRQQVKGLIQKGLSYIFLIQLYRKWTKVFT